MPRMRLRVEDIIAARMRRIAELKIGCACCGSDEVRVIVICGQCYAVRRRPDELPGTPGKAVDA